MDKCIDLQTKEEVLEIIKKYPEIKRINHFNSTPVGYQYQISLTIFVDGNLSNTSSSSSQFKYHMLVFYLLIRFSKYSFYVDLHTFHLKEFIFNDIQPL